ncbi:MAG TPA: hypothetical protein VM095_19540 [Pyrinomonadaceae bacterium]|nr:hypothetical protein [Pyrinomonadaceae bacterium]
MLKLQKVNHHSRDRSDERGVALVAVLLISTLLLTAGGLLLLTTSMSATNTGDAAAEMQAYYTAEAGLQRTLNVMRSRDIPAGTMPAGSTELTFRDFVKNPTLDKWIPFDGPTIDGAKTTLISTNAFSVYITDPDDQNAIVALRKVNINPSYQPARLNIRMIGYGPKRAKKILNMTVARGGLSGFQAPATITLVGSDSLPHVNLTFDTGDSNSVRYTGNDAAGGAGISAFAVTIPDVIPTLAGIQKTSQVVGPPVSVLGPSSPLAGVPPTPKPEWLESPEAARDFVYGERGLMADAIRQQRYFTTQPDVENMSNPKQITFVDGDVELGAGDQGAGLLVVTGKLLTHGNTSFKGVIYVLGEGVVERKGGGNGVIAGGIVVAKFGKTSGEFEAPTFTTDGGGNSLLQYDSKSVSDAMTAIPGFLVVGVVEK